MSSCYGNNYKISIFGESHGEAIGVTIDGVPSGTKIDMDFIKSELNRRRAVDVTISTPRSEPDEFEILSGVVDGVACGTPICAICKNTNKKSKDYDAQRSIARPSHADYTGYVKYHGYNDVRGGGHFSGRITAPLVFAGAVAKLVLMEKGIYIGAHILSIKDVAEKSFEEISLTKEVLDNLKKDQFSTLETDKKLKMKLVITNALKTFDSVGGVVECAVLGMPAGIGSPMFDGLENKISSAVFAIPAIKGIEFGLGFGSTKLYGSENNDEFFIDSISGGIKTKTNNHGGILGGISSSMPIIFRVAIKPTPTIRQEQQTVDFKRKVPVILKAGGRHDPCIVPRAVVCVESAAAIAILDSFL